MKNLLPFLIVLTIFTGCTSRNNRKSELLSNIQQLLPHQPDSALYYLEKNRDYIISREEKAVIHLMEHYINDLNQYNYQKDSLTIEVLHNSHHYKTDYDKALASYYKGAFLMTKYEYEKAIELFHTSELIANKIKWDHLLGMIYNKSSEVFYDLGLYNTSIEYADKSITHFTIAGDDNYANRAHAYKIFSLFELKEEEDAQDFYNLTKKHALKANDFEYLNHICSEIISIKLFYDDTHGAEEYYKDMVNFSANKKTPIQHLYLGNKYTKENQLDSAAYYLSLVKEDSLADYDRILLKSSYSDFYRKKGDFSKALEFMDENLALWDTVIHYGQRSSLVKVESRSQNLKTSLLYEKKVAARERMVYWILIIFFGFVIAALIYHNRTKKQKDEMNNRIAVVSQIVSELKDSNKTLLSKLDIHKEKENQLKEHIESKLEYVKMFADLYSKFHHKPTTFLKKMDELIDLMPTNKEFTTGIVNMVNLYYNNAIEKLTEKHDDLTNSEVLFSALIIAGFSVHEMSLILNCNSVDAVYTRKYRLKQKLYVNKNTDIEDYLSTFVGE